jgi:CubicO group peptidase (beta-lactamase class C family)
MRFLVFAFLFFSSLLATAQNNDPPFGRVNDSIVSLFNKGNFEAIYVLGSAAFKQNENKEAFITFLKGLKNETGNISSTHISHCNDRVGYKWTGQRKNLRVEWKTSHLLTFDDYFINDLIDQRYKREPITDNKLGSRIDSLVHQYVSYYLLDSNAVGLSIGIVKNGKSHLYNYGEVKKGTKQLPNSTSFYELGSIAKTFIATLLAKAAIEGKVSLQDDIRKYLPGEYPNLVYKTNPIRLAHLANHTSGLPESFRAFPFDSIGRFLSDQQFAYFEQYTKESLFKDLQQIKPDTIPGSSYRYNSNAFHILVAILERVYQKPYEELLTQYLATHLQMPDTKNNLSAAELRRFVQGYNGASEPMEHYNNPKTMTGGPGLNSTLTDMVKYVEANLSEQRKAIRLTHKITWGNKDNFAVGLSWMMNNTCHGDRYIYHSGRSRGCNSICSFYPEKKLGIVILVNETVNQGRLFVLERLLIQELNKTTGNTNH